MTMNMTPRQREVADLLAEGKAPKQVARELGIATHTVRVHIMNAKRRAGARSTLQLIVQTAKERQRSTAK